MGTEKPKDKVRKIRFWSLFTGALVISFVFFLFIFIQLYKNSKGNIIRLEQSDVRSNVINLNVYLDTAINAITFTKENMEVLHDRGASSEEISSSMVLITQTFLAYIEDNIAGAYGYIYGNYVDGHGWIPDADYDPKSRPWYLAAVERPGEIVYVPPYVDAESGQVCVTLSKTMDDDRESVVAFDLALTSLQKNVEESAAKEAVISSRIIDADDRIIIASNQESEILSSFTSKEDYPELWAIMDQDKAGFVEMVADGKKVLIFSEPLTINWRLVQVFDERILFRSLLNIYLFSGIGSFAVLAAILTAFILLKVNYERADRLFHESRTDALTGIQNRGGGEDDIEKLLRDRVPGMFLMFDADKFKRINDTYGHDMGDKVLISIAKTLQTSVRRGDPAMRLGGDEFVAYLPGITTSEQAQNFVNRLFEGIARIRIPGLEDVVISISAGAVFYDGETIQHFADLYQAADERIYASKKQEGSYITY